ncbi:MAG: sugar ABC transporter substrate-binding protein [Ardenticatenaceae bacterium]|nr:sugar ABC transporter substrate-binding protein [Ardenticatenaceae bacterium]HBY95729.1 ABC transporter substrate-binding protein [Chloroflexota bacterium]
MLRKTRVIAGFALLLLLLVACGGGGGAAPTAEPLTTTIAAPEATSEAQTPATGQGASGVAAGTVKLWFHSGRGEERDALNKILDNFRATNSGVTVDAVELPEGSYNDQVQAAAFANDLPCLLDFDGPFVYNYAWGGFLIPLDQYLTPEMKDDFLPSIIQQGTFQDGKLYSLGQFDSGLAIWANKEQLDTAGVRIPTLDKPWTKDEFNQALASLQKVDGIENALDLKMNYGRGEWFTYGFSPILQSFGGDLIDRSSYKSTDGVLNGSESVAAMEMVQGWFKDGYVNPQPPGDTAFVEGKSALSWVGHWVANQYMDELGDNLLLLPMPDFGKGPKTGMGSWNWGITSNCSNPDAAWKVLSFLVEPDQILVMTDANGAVPARKSALAKSKLYGPDGKLNLLVKQLEGGIAVPRPITPAYPAITSAFQEAFDNIKNGADVKSELDKAVKKIDQDIEDNQGYPIK